jgi:hypothetical protein
MKVLLRYKKSIEEVEIEEKIPPGDLIITFAQPKVTKEFFAFVGKADGMPYYRFMREVTR